MGDRLTVSGLIEDTPRVGNALGRVRRRAGTLRAPLPEMVRGTGYEAVRHTLGEILRSASGVVGAAQAFLLVARGDTVLEVAATHDIPPSEVINAVLLQASLPIHTAMREHIIAAGDLQGCVLPLLENALDRCAPAVLCVPLDLGPRQSGVLCLLRTQQPHRLSDLDLEIVQALAEQASLAIGAARHSSALSRLQASLSRLAPAYA